MKTALINLRLIECPLTNRECDWLWEDEEMKQFLSQSNLYCIVQRSEVFFKNFSECVPGHLCFSLVGNNGKRIDDVRIDLQQFLAGPGDEVEIESGSKILRLKKGNELIAWYSIDRLLFQYWRGDLKVEGLEDFRQCTDFDLHYVGISKESDSFSRLFKNGHEKRAKILSQERQLTPDASLTDEILILFFDPEHIGMSVYSASDEIPACVEDLIATVDKTAMIADAEKALVKILDSEYNTIKYRNYPKGLDGLFDSGLTRYAFYLGDDISLVTYDSEIRGSAAGICQEDVGPDLIVVEGEKAKLVRFEEQLTKFNEQNPESDR